MGLIAEIIAEVEQVEDRDEERAAIAAALQEDWKLINNDLRQVIAPAAGEVTLDYEGCVLSTDGRLRETCTWTVRPTTVTRLRPFSLVYRRGDGWRLEQHDDEGRERMVNYVALYPAIYPDWRSSSVREFLRRQLRAQPSAETTVWVLADWNGEPPATSHWEEERVLIRFANRQIVAALHGLVANLHPLTTAAAKLNILSAAVEVTSNQVSAFRTHADLETPGQGLGDGLLLLRRSAPALRGEEIEGITLEVRDDGMLLVHNADRTGWATIDLTQLAATVAGRR